MSIHEISFPSANGRDTVKGWIYTPIAAPRGIVQLIHGFGEHSRRYLHMIDKLTEAGFIVCADDHIGHGKTGTDNGSLGDPGTSGKDGWRVYLADEKALHDLTVKAYPCLPYLVFGHSWGSMLARGYAALYGGDLRAMALCGVVSQMKGCELLAHDAALLGRLESQILSDHGGDKGGDWMGLLFGTLVERIPDAKSPNDWIANDPRVVADHAGDPFNCFDVTTQLLYDFFRLYQFIEGPDWAGMVPAGLPAFLMSGDCDPCGNYGEGLYHVANLLAEAGHPVEVHAYSGYRHEIHNQRELRDGVEDSLVDFLTRAVS